MRRYWKVVFLVVMSAMSFSVIAAQTASPIAEADLPVISAANAGQVKLLTTIPAYKFSGFSPDSKLLYTRDGDFNLQEWDIAAGKSAMTVPVGGGDIVISPDGKTIYHLNADGLETWDATTGKMVSAVKLENAPQSATFRVISPSGKFVGQIDTGGSKDTLVWDASTGKILYTLKFDISSGASLVFFPDDSAVLIYNDAGAVEAVSLKDGSVMWTQKSQNTNGGQFAFSPDSKTLAILGTFGMADVIDTTSGKLEATIPGDTTGVHYTYGAAFSPDSKTLVVMMDTGAATTYDLSGKPQATVQTDSDFVMFGSPPAFNADGTLEVLQIDAATVQIADVTAAKVVGTAKSSSAARIRSILFSPDGKLLAIPFNDGTVELWGVGS